jgi:LmbE family N-acetylglucosaminyl deacetylase
MPTPDRACPIFLSPHYDDVALSCGGTVAALSESGEQPLIITCFGGSPPGPLNDFARDMHLRWRVDAGEAIAIRRAEETCAADVLGAGVHWLDFPDAIYRGSRYTSDDELFGTIHPDEMDLPTQIVRALEVVFARLGVHPSRLYVPLGIGNHVDHQHVVEVGRRFSRRGYEVFAYEDFPYAGDPGVEHHGRALTGEEPVTHLLTAEQLERRVAAILCYRSQLSVIFRHQGDPAESTRRYATANGASRPGERFWPLHASPTQT